MPNSPISDHPLKGTTHTYRADLPPYDGDKDRTPGRLVVGHGMTVIIKAVFQNWNDVAGLDMFYVFCTATGMHTHVTPADLGLPDSEEQHPANPLAVSGNTPRALTAEEYARLKPMFPEEEE